MPRLPISILVLAAGLSAQNTAILPKAFATKMANSANTFPHARANMRYQQVFLGSEIGRPSIFRQVCLRLDERFGGPAQAQSMQLYLGSSKQDHTNLTANFASNYSGTTPRTKLFDGTINLPAHTSGGGINDFKICFKFSRIFLWRGMDNLLVEFINKSASSRSHFEDFCGRGSTTECTTTRVYAFDQAATTAQYTFRNQGLVMRFDNTNAGAYTTFGSGCRGSSGAPTLANSGVPELGKQFSITLANARANSSALLWFGLRVQQSLPGNCTLYASPAVLATVTPTNASGTASVPISIPNTTSLVGVQFANQWWVADPTGALLGLLALSNGGEGNIGG